MVAIKSFCLAGIVLQGSSARGEYLVAFTQGLCLDHFAWPDRDR